MRGNANIAVSRTLEAGGRRLDGEAGTRDEGREKLKAVSCQKKPSVYYILYSVFLFKDPTLEPGQSSGTSDER